MPSNPHGSIEVVWIVGDAGFFEDLDQFLAEGLGPVMLLRAGRLVWVEGMRGCCWHPCRDAGFVGTRIGWRRYAQPPATGCGASGFGVLAQNCCCKMPKSRSCRSATSSPSHLRARVPLFLFAGGGRSHTALSRENATWPLSFSCWNEPPDKARTRLSGDCSSGFLHIRRTDNRGG